MNEYWPDFHVFTEIVLTFHVFNKNIFLLCFQYAGKSCSSIYLHISHDVHLLISFIFTRISLITIYSSHITSVANSPSSFTAKTFSIALT